MKVETYTNILEKHLFQIKVKVRYLTLFQRRYVSFTEYIEFFSETGTELATRNNHPINANPVDCKDKVAIFFFAENGAQEAVRKSIATTWGAILRKDR